MNPEGVLKHSEASEKHYKAVWKKWEKLWRKRRPTNKEIEKFCGKYKVEFTPPIYKSALMKTNIIRVIPNQPFRIFCDGKLMAFYDAGGEPFASRFFNRGYQKVKVLPKENEPT